jgi:site-specific recombinase XerC
LVARRRGRVSASEPSAAWARWSRWARSASHRPRRAARHRPRALDEQARIRWLRAVEAHLSSRDRTLALIPYYAGAWISEVVALDVLVAELLGHARLETTRRYSRTTDKDKADALNLITTDR